MAPGQPDEIICGLVVGRVAQQRWMTTNLSTASAYSILFDDGRLELLGREALCRQLRQQLTDTAQKPPPASRSTLPPSLAPDQDAVHHVMAGAGGTTTTPAAPSSSPAPPPTVDMRQGTPDGRLTMAALLASMSAPQQLAQQSPSSLIRQITMLQHVTNTQQQQLMQQQQQQQQQLLPAAEDSKDDSKPQETERFGEVVWYRFRGRMLPGLVVDPDDKNPRVRFGPDVLVLRRPDAHLILSLDDNQYVWTTVGGNRVMDWKSDKNFELFGPRMAKSQAGTKAVQVAIQLSGWKPSEELLTRAGFHDLDLESEEDELSSEAPPPPKRRGRPPKRGRGGYHVGGKRGRRAVRVVEEHPEEEEEDDDDEDEDEVEAAGGQPVGQGDSGNEGEGSEGDDEDDSDDGADAAPTD
ncbi:unnamed protein product [Vitrella brassicaformis CCMP3155]|uniref:Uncharacterized protein n=1 Tax=Vitrella brassicaformis (strain CCMP3155) TaxID=1169540 RepID=A0A0G4F2M1_VITBC|nr:unnamed protein product [Vitrella brassicaformis CCMP3155]|eukprot:CEM05631.1 unnamed protein product [Vitrella brassicaformis CCMP3155]